jgi:3-deoxy-7-phosphoheptulonate synthase
MLIRMHKGASQGDIEYVKRRVDSLGLSTHVSQSAGHVLISLLGDLETSDLAALAGLRGVERVLNLRRSYRLASREFESADTEVFIGDLRVGGEQVIVMAGPCSVESRQQLMETAHRVREAGGHLLRGGAFKPRTSPYSFQGLAEAGLELLAEAREKTGLRVVTEVMTPEQVDVVGQYADVLQIGTRNMQNFMLLNAVGQSGLPVLLKRGLAATIEELLLSAEYVMARGNHQVILCERGIRTFETATRNTMDISAVPVLGELTHLPVVVDPSHGTGKASLVKPMCRAAVAAGADGLLIEVHPDPESALSDGPQSLTPQQFGELMGEVGSVAMAVGRCL